MPRKKLIYTNLYPYHVCARANNKEWFYLPKEQIWNIFKYHLNQIVQEYKVIIHAFVLMDNHYHLLITTTFECDLGEVMCHYQKSVSRTINSQSGRINHVFGGPYKASLIRTPDQYFHIYKYVYRNPIQAGIVNDIMEYRYSTLQENCEIQTALPTNGIDTLIPYNNLKLWINEAFRDEI